MPAQTGFAEATMDKLTGSNGNTVIVTVFEVAGFPLVHVSLEVRMQVIVLPLTGIKA